MQFLNWFNFQSKCSKDIAKAGPKLLCTFCLGQSLWTHRRAQKLPPGKRTPLPIVAVGSALPYREHSWVWKPAQVFLGSSQMTHVFLGRAILPLLVNLHRAFTPSQVSQLSYSQYMLMTNRYTHWSQVFYNLFQLAFCTALSFLL